MKNRSFTSFWFMASRKRFLNHESGTVPLIRTHGDMKNLKSKECLFPLTMSILTDHSRKHQNWAEVNN